MNLSHAGLALSLSATFLVAQAPDGTERSYSEDPRVMLDYAQFDPLVGTPEVLASLRSTASTGLFIVQFHSTPTDEDRAAVVAAGGVIRGYLPHDCHVVYMRAGALGLVDAVQQVRWVGAYQPAYRLEPFLRNQIATGVEMPKRRYNMVMANKRGDKRALAQKIAMIGGKTTDEHLEGLLFTAELTKEQLIAAANLDEVLWIDRWEARERDVNNGRVQGGANAIETAAGYTGTGVRVHVYEGVELNHPDFNTTFTNVSSAGETDRHGHCTAGIILGNGTSASAARGFAPDAVGFFTNYDSDVGSRNSIINTVVNTRQCLLTTSSWGSGLTGNYTSISADADDIVFDHRIPWTQSMSNWGTQTAVRPQAWAKNIISVGGVWHGNNSNANDDSWAWPGPGGAPFADASIGPAADSRNKPDLCAYYDSILTSDLRAGVPNWAGATSPNLGGYTTANWTSGFGGTSGATPMVAGMNTLAAEMYTDHIFSNTPRVQNGNRFQNRPYAQTLKALMITGANLYAPTATNNRREHVGWGFPDVNNLYTRRDKIAIIPEFAPISQGGQHVYEFEVVPGETSLKFCMTYLDPAGNPAASFDRVNDLDLRIESPFGLSYWGNFRLDGANQQNFSTNGGFRDSRDTVECCFFNNPVAGVWKAYVTAPVVTIDAHVATNPTDATYALVANGGRRVYGSGCARYVPDISASGTTGNYYPWGGYAPAAVTTTMTSNSGGGTGGTVYFDLTTTSPIYMHSLMVNTSAASGETLLCDVYRASGTHVGKETDLAQWQALSAGRGSSEGLNVASQIDLSTPFYLPTGTHGFAVTANNFAHRYTVGANTYASGGITIETGSATNGLMGPATVYSPRTANITFKYRTATANGSNMRYQMILRSDELGAAGQITGLGFSGQSYGRHYNTNLQVRMSHVPAGYTLSNFFSSNLPASNLVMSANKHSFDYGNGVWRNIGLHSSFNYNGTSDVVVDITARGNVQTTNGSAEGLFHRSTNEGRLYKTNWTSTPSSGTLSATGGMRMRVSFNCADANEMGHSCGSIRAFHTGNGSRGSSLQFVALDALPNNLAFIALSQNNGYPFPVSLNSFGWTNCHVFGDSVSIVTETTNSIGLASHWLSIPNSSSLDGVKVFGQWLQLDASESGGISFSNYTRMIVGLNP